MPRTFCLLNHNLTKNQLEELKEKFSSQEIIYPTEEIKNFWSQILPEKENTEIIESVVLWLKSSGAKDGDLFIIQGEFGSTFTLVDYALKNHLVPIYATTKRISKEIRNGEKVQREYIFEHVQFKKYKYFDELSEQ